MGKTIDTKVVELEFDNAQFEAGVKESLSSLDKLHNALEGKGFNTSALDKLQDSLSSSKIGGLVSRFSETFQNGLGTVGSAIESVTDKLGGLKTAMAVVGGLATTGVVAQAISGGKKRAQNIEFANFMFEGLFPEEVGKENGIIAKALDQVNESVMGTAFGYDQAAKAAAQLAASGIEVGEAWTGNIETSGELAVALRAMAGVASMGGGDYERVASIFTTVAGNGKVMASELNRIGDSGVNARAALASYLGIAESDVAELSRKGQIDFRTFSNAMAFAFGDSAARANELFSGALSNIKASLSRMGAQFAAPAYDFGKRIMQSLLLSGENDKGPIKQFENVLKPLSNAWTLALNGLGTHVTAIIDAIGYSGAIEGLANVFESIGNVITGIGSGIGSGIQFIGDHLSVIGDIAGNLSAGVVDRLKLFGEAIRSVFGETPKFDVGGALEKVRSVTEKFRPSEERLEQLKAKLESVLTVLKEVGEFISRKFGNVIEFLYPKILSLLPTLDWLKLKFERFLDVFRNSGFSLEPIRNGIETLKQVFDNFANTFSDGLPSWDDFIALLTSSKEQLSAAGEEIADNFILGFGTLSDKIKNKIVEIAEHFPEYFDSFKSKLSDVVTLIDPESIFNSFFDFIISIPDRIKSLFDEGGLLENLDISSVLEKCFSKTDGLTSAADTFDGAAETIKKAGSKFEEAKSLVETACDGIHGALDNLKERLGNMFSDLDFDSDDLVVAVSGIFTALMMLVILKGLFDVVGIIGDLHAISSTIANVATSIDDAVKLLGKSLSGLVKSAKRFSMAALIGSIALSILSFAIALKILAGIDLPSLAKGVVALTVVLVAMGFLVKWFQKLLDSSGGAVNIQRISLSLAALALALGLVAVSCMLFSVVPWESMGKGGAALAAVVVAAALLAAISNKLGSFVKIAASIVAISLALSALAVACILFTFVPVESMAKASAALGGLIAGVFALSIIQKLTGGLGKAAVSLVLMAQSLLILAVACKMFATVPVEGMDNATSAMIRLMLGITLLAVINQYVGGITSGAAAMIGLSVALVIFAIACRSFTEIDEGAFTAAANAMVIIALLIGILAVVGNGASFAGMAIAFVGLSASLVVFAAALMLLSMIPADALTRSFLILAGALIALVVAAAFAGMPEVGAGLILLAGSIAVLSLSLLVGAIGVGLFAAAFMVLGATAPAAAASMVLAFGNLAGAFGSMLAISAGCIILAVAFIGLGAGGVIGAIGVSLLVVALLGLVAVVGVMVLGVMAVFSALPVGLANLGPSVGSSMGVVVESMKTGLLQGLQGLLADNPITKGIDDLVKGASDFFKGSDSSELNSGMQEIGKGATDSVGTGIEEGRPDVIAKVTGMFDSVIAEGDAKQPDLFNLGDMSGANITEGLDGSLDLTSVMGPEMQQMLGDAGISMDQLTAITGEGGFDATSALGTGLSGMPDEAQSSATDAVGNINSVLGSAGSNLYSTTQSATAQIPKGAAAGAQGTDKAVENELTKAKNKISSYSQTILSTSRSTFSKAQTGARSGSSGMANAVGGNTNSAVGRVRSYSGSAHSAGYNVGSNFALGMSNGINAYASGVAARAARMVSDAKAAADKAQKSGSPSREMYKRGKWFVQGFALGIRNTAGEAQIEASVMADSAINRAVEGFSNLSSLLDSIDYNPTIRPVFDGTQLESGIQNARRMMLQNQMVSAGYAGRSYAMGFGTDNSIVSGDTIINVDLHYGADADANTMALGLASALRSRNLMEGVVR